MRSNWVTSGNLLLFSYDELGVFFQFFQLRDAARQALIVRVAVDGAPLLLLLDITLLGMLGNFLLDPHSLDEQLLPRGSGTWQIALEGTSTKNLLLCM